MHYKYKVSTQHEPSAEFIVPVSITAPSPQEAAEQRFRKQLENSKASTNALLVVDEFGRGHVFPVGVVTTTRVLSALVV
jgi:hypothetical protein